MTRSAARQDAAPASKSAEAVAGGRRRRIVVGVDGSPESGAALGWAIELARDLEAEVVAVHALDTDLAAYLTQQVGTRFRPGEWEARIRRDFSEQWCAPLREAGIPHREQVVKGVPAKVLTRVATRLSAELVVVGRRGRRGVAGLLLGSVAAELARESEVPVVVFPDRVSPST